MFNVFLHHVVYGRTRFEWEGSYFCVLEETSTFCQVAQHFRDANVKESTTSICRLRRKFMWGQADGGKDLDTPWPKSWKGEPTCLCPRISQKRATFCLSSLKQQYEPLLQDDFSARLLKDMNCTDYRYPASARC